MHSKNESTKRSVAYNRTPVGRAKKKSLNNKRSKYWVAPEPVATPKPVARVEGLVSSTGIDVGPIAQDDNDSDLQPSNQAESTPGPEFDKGMIGYLQMALTLIEGRKVSRDEVIELLAKTVRQRSFDREGRFQYILRNLTEKPP